MGKIVVAMCLGVLFASSWSWAGERIELEPGETISLRGQDEGENWEVRCPGEGEAPSCRISSRRNWVFLHAGGRMIAKAHGNHKTKDNTESVRRILRLCQEFKQEGMCSSCRF